MKKRFLAMFLALVMCVALLPSAALAAETSQPDWYFLFAIFKNVDADAKDRNGNAVHAKYTMSQKEVDTYRGNAKDFENYLTGTGVMRAHVDVVEIDTSVTELETGSLGSYLAAKQAAPLLQEAGIDLDRYDHVTCLISLNISTGYVGLGGMTFENRTGQTCINTKNWEYCQEHFVSGSTPWTLQVCCHEFLHFMENMTQKFGTEFDLHGIRIDHYTPDTDNGKECYTDIILNRARGDAGTGVHPAVWQYPPHVLRTMTELTVPSGVTSIGVWAFGCLKKHTTLTKVSIPVSVTSIGYAAFYNASIEDVYYSGTEEQWKAIQIGEYNQHLTSATIHYNSTIPATPDQPAKDAAHASAQTVTMDGKPVEFQMYALKDANGYDTNYIKLRDMAYALMGTKAQFSVGFTADAQGMTITAASGGVFEPNGDEMTDTFGGADKSFTKTVLTIQLDGKPVELEAITLKDDAGGGYNYCKVADLGKVFNFNVYWKGGTGICVETDKPYTGK